MSGPSCEVFPLPCHVEEWVGGGTGGLARVHIANPDLLPTAQMGVGEGKSIGQWYGPNTVAQVLRYVLSCSMPSPLGSLFTLVFMLSSLHCQGTPGASSEVPMDVGFMFSMKRVSYPDCVHEIKPSVPSVMVAPEIWKWKLIWNHGSSDGCL